MNRKIILLTLTLLLAQIKCSTTSSQTVYEVGVTSCLINKLKSYFPSNTGS
jgi:hypothetical protein